MKKDKIQEAYESMLTEAKIEAEATLESVDDYLFMFSQAVRNGTLQTKNLKSDLEWAENKLDQITKNIKGIKKIINSEKKK